MIVVISIVQMMILVILLPVLEDRLFLLFCCISEIPSFLSEVLLQCTQTKERLQEVHKKFFL